MCELPSERARANKHTCTRTCVHEITHAQEHTRPRPRSCERQCRRAPTQPHAVIGTPEPSPRTREQTDAPEYQHQPDSFDLRGGPLTADHVDILGSSPLNSAILKIASGRGDLVEEHIGSDILEYVERMDWDGAV